MYAMFYQASSFNQDLNSWITTKVQELGSMFESATSFNSTIKDWTTSKVTSMYDMFFYANSFNQPLDSLDVGKVSFMNYMFYDASSFNQCLSTWPDKVRKNVDTYYMLDFTSCPCLTDDDSDNCGTPLVGVGPWCQTAANCPAAPDCKDDEAIKFIINKKNKGCEKIKANQCQKKYKIEGKVGRKTPEQFCPKICNKDCLVVDKCDENKIKKYKLEGNPGQFNCRKIKKKNLCDINLKGEDTLAKAVCPQKCKIKGCKK